MANIESEQVAEDRTWSLDELARAFDPAASDTVFVSGSRLEGLGNQRSDYDLYVIQKEGYGGLPFVTVVVNKSYAVYESFSQSHVARVADTLNTLSTTDFPSVWRISWNDLEFYYRVVIGRALTNEAEFKRLQAGFERAVIERCVHVWTGLRSVVHQQQAERQLEQGRPIAAYVSAQQAAAAAVDSFLAARGEAYPGFKWRFEKLRRAGPSCAGVEQRWWSLKALGTRRPDDYVAEVVAFCRELGMPAFAGWSVDQVPCRPMATARLVAVENDVFIAENKTTLFRLSEAGRRIWDWLGDYPTRSDVARRAEAEALMSADEAHRLLAALEEHGLLQ